MKQLYALILILFCLLFISCDKHMNYDEAEQIEIVSMLTGTEWRQTYEQMSGYEPTEYDEDGWIYKFNSNRSGSYKWFDRENCSIIGDVVYFRWDFTTKNFAVIYIDKSQQFWLIDKLTPTELWVYSAFQDPVLYPNTSQTFRKFTAVKYND